MFKFETLKVWKKSIRYNNDLLSIANELHSKYKYSFCDQLTRASISITNNIAEGSGRKDKKDEKNFYNMAKGSVYETVNILFLMRDNSLIDKKIFDEKYKEAEEICKMLSGLIRKK